MVVELYQSSLNCINHHIETMIQFENHAYKILNQFILHLEMF